MENLERERLNNIKKRAEHMTWLQHVIIAIVSTIYATMIGFISHNVILLILASLLAQVLFRVLMLGDSRKDQDIFWFVFSGLLVVLLLAILL